MDSGPSFQRLQKRAADAVLQRFQNTDLCSPGIGAAPQQAETMYFRDGGNTWFFAFVYTDALLATISLTPKQLEKSVLLSGSDLSYNERTIGLTVHCKSFHARTANCEPTLPLQRSIYAG